METICAPHYKYARLCKQIYSCKYDAKCVKLSNSKGIIVIEGTDTFSDWKHNIMFMFKNKADIHRGFYLYTKRVIDEYNIHTMFNTCSHLTITGHSLGGAAALIIVYLMSQELEELPYIDLVLFGCPKMGGTSFKDTFKNIEKVNVYNYKNGNDVVCHLPIGFGYTNIHPIIPIGNSKLKLPSVRDHLMEQYIQSLETLSLPVPED